MSAREVYRKTRKVPDLFWNARVCRPIAALLVDALQGTRTTPNQITLAAVAVAALAAAVLVLAPGHLGLLLGVLIFQASYVLDCADGMLARWRGTASASGHLLDFLMDEIKAFLILAAVAVRLYLEQRDPLYLILGILGLVALASGVALTTFLRRPEVVEPVQAPETAQTPSSGARRGLSRVVGWVESAAKFVIHYPSYILYAAIAGRIELYFFPYLLVNALYAARTFASVTLRFGRSAAG